MISYEVILLFQCCWLTVLFLISLYSTGSYSSSSSSSPTLDSFGNGPAPCLGASLRPVVWLASCESEEGSSKVIEPAHPSHRSLALKWLLTLDSVVTPTPLWPTMPFRLKLRRTRRYNVLSKNYFVTRIRLLDNTVIECTLSVESTGQECLEAVAQRLELREVSLLLCVPAACWYKVKQLRDPDVLKHLSSVEIFRTNQLIVGFNFIHLC